MSVFSSDHRVIVRPEERRDHASVRAVHEQAFGQPTEADLVDAVRHLATSSLVAVLEDRVVGHILFTPVTIESGSRSFAAVGLAPMAVIPGLQRQGLGSLLVERGLEACLELDHMRVVVLGHPHYYPRFGFVPASRFGVRCEYDVPDEVFMALELVPGAFRDVSGTAKYLPEFNEG